MCSVMMMVMMASLCLRGIDCGKRQCDGGDRNKFEIRFHKYAPRCCTGFNTPVFDLPNRKGGVAAARGDNAAGLLTYEGHFWR
jgi:hypothetical protein